MTRNNRFFLLLMLVITASCMQNKKTKVFDVHLHGEPDANKQIATLKEHGVYRIALSSSWDSQQSYQSTDDLHVLQGLMIPCPNGKVPYSLQSCFRDGNEWPEPVWVEEQIKEGRIDFIGEVLAQYHGISSSDSALYPYYALAEKYNIPVGIHTGSAGPNHGCPNFKEELGNPTLLINALTAFPKLRVWLMHGGGPFTQETFAILEKYPEVYIDISVLNNPDIIPPQPFSEIMRSLMDAGFEDRILFGSDNANIQTTLASIHKLEFLSEKQQEKILWMNGERFFNIH